MSFESPVLKIGTTLAVLRLWGNIPVLSDLLIIFARVCEIIGPMRLITLLGYVEKWHGLFFKLLIIFSTSEADIGEKKKELGTDSKFEKFR